MAVSAVPALIDALVSTARSTVPAGINVFDGFGVSEDPGSFLMIGIDDPSNTDAALSATVSQDWANANATARDEEGDITCVALSWNGDEDQKAARDAAYATVEALAGALRANPSLGLSSLLWTSFGTDLELYQNQDDNGAVARVVFRIHFRARI